MPSALAQLQVLIATARRISDDAPMENRSISARHTNSIVYGDKVASVEDELKYPYPREQLPLFKTSASAKGPLFIRIHTLNSFKRVHTKDHTHLNRPVSGTNSRPSIFLGFDMTADTSPTYL